MTVKYQSRSSKLTLAITSQPTTTEYIAGDILSLTGLVVTATRRDGTPVNVTSQCIFSPANGSTLSSSGTQTITATYQGKKITTTVSVYALDRIAVTTAPTKTTYYAGEAISYSGIVVKAYANSDNLVRTVTSECSYSPASGTIVSTQGSFNATITWRNKSATQSYNVTVKIYGAEWAGGSSSAWTRTDDAANFSNPSPAVNNGSGSSPFDNILPWSGMGRIAEGGQNQILVEIPKYYYKWTRTGSKLKLQISQYQFTGSYVSPAHANRGDGKGERDYVYVGAYHCANVSSSSLHHYHSLSGRTPITNITRATARSNIHSYVGNSYWQFDIAMYWTICMLYLVEYADWNVQSKIGLGVCSTSGEATGQTDNMKYHTGTSASSRSTLGHVRYRFIEDLWANVRQFVDGIMINTKKIYIYRNPSNFSDTSTSGGTNIGTLPSTTSVCMVTAFTFNSTSDYAYIPIPSSVTTTIDYTKYTCDQAKFASVTNGIYYVGGANTTDNESQGLFIMVYTADSTYAHSKVGCRLMKLP